MEPEDLIVERFPDGEVLVYDLATDEAHCLDADAAREWDSLGTTSRRSMLKRAAVVGAVGVPAIRSLVAPTAAQASSLTQSGGGCSSPAQCQSGLCNGGVCA